MQDHSNTICSPIALIDARLLVTEMLRARDAGISIVANRSCELQYRQYGKSAVALAGLKKALPAMACQSSAE